MKTAFKTIAISSIYSCLILSVITASAQKLPAVQENGFRAPENVKVDAKLSEWSDFQAFNKTTNVYYTMANDDKNLYFVMKSTDQTTNNKIIGGGINLTINTANKKSDKGAFVLIFPVINPANLRSQIMGMGASGQQPDSAAIEGMRRKAVSAFKEIKLVGFKDIPDSVVSVYNEYGIKGFVDFDSKGALVMEMAVPLKELNMGGSKDAAFNYNVKLNGINIDAIFPGAGAMMAGMGGGMGGGSFGGGGGQPMVVSTPRAAGGGMPHGMGDIMGMLSPTDFWGKYTLVKK